MKLKELFEAPRATSAQQTPQDNSSSFISKIKREINPTGEGEKRLSAKRNALLQQWYNYKGETNAIQNSPNIEHWVKGQLRLDNPEIWAQAIDEFSQDDPTAGQKYANAEKLDGKEVEEFFNKLIQIRLMHPEIPLRDPRVAYNPDNKQAVQQPSTTKNKSSVPSSDDETEVKQTKLPQHPVFSNTGLKATTKQPEANTQATAQKNNPAINPEPVNPNKPAMLKPDAKDAVDWEKVRSRFPNKPVPTEKK